MRLHDRYIFRELLAPLAICFGAFLIFWLSLFFTQEIEQMREAKLHFFETVEFAIAKLPGILVMVLPFILLFGMLWALTQHARHNEITALRAAGISVIRVCVPYFIIGFLTVGIYFALNEIVAPACDRWADTILKKPTKPFVNVGFRNSHAARLWKIGEFLPAAKTALNVHIIWNTEDGLQHQLKADQAVYTNKIWTFYNVQPFAQADAHGGLLQLAATNEMAMPEFKETPRQIARYLRFTDTQGTLASRGADVPLEELWPYLQDNPGVSGREGARLRTKMHERIAAPWTCFIVVLMAIPFGAPSGRRNLFYGVAGSILICFSFFILQQVSLAFGMGGQMTPWVAAWLPNIVFGIIGFFLTLRVR